MAGKISSFSRGNALELFLTGNHHRRQRTREDGGVNRHNDQGGGAHGTERDSGQHGLSLVPSLRLFGEDVPGLEGRAHCPTVAELQRDVAPAGIRPGPEEWRGAPAVQDCKLHMQRGQDGGLARGRQALFELRWGDDRQLRVDD